MSGFEPKDGEEDPFEFPLRQHVQSVGNSLGCRSLHAFWLYFGALDGLSSDGRQFGVCGVFLVVVEVVQETVIGFVTNARVQEVGGEWRVVGPRGDFRSPRTWGQSTTEFFNVQ